METLINDRKTKHNVHPFNDFPAEAFFTFFLYEKTKTLGDNDAKAIQKTVNYFLQVDDVSKECVSCDTLKTGFGMTYRCWTCGKVFNDMELDQLMSSRLPKQRQLFELERAWRWMKCQFAKSERIEKHKCQVITKSYEELLERFKKEQEEEEAEQKRIAEASPSNRKNSRKNSRKSSSKKDKNDFLTMFENLSMEEQEVIKKQLLMKSAESKSP
jgi:DNA-directed RNA polymerase subunit N (RpoN/RPB10)